MRAENPSATSSLHSSMIGGGEESDQNDLETSNITVTDMISNNKYQNDIS
jgi:hypothetical protein